MKNEYIAGDLVKYLSQVVKIVDVYQDGTCYFGNETMCGQQDCKDAEPIPLTPEILKKNGWELDNATWIYKKGYIRVFRLLDDKTYAAYIFGVRVFEFHFIHELQHLLFGLGLNSEMEV